jgi:hypothetical protein
LQASDCWQSASLAITQATTRSFDGELVLSAGTQCPLFAQILDARQSWAEPGTHLEPEALQFPSNLQFPDARQPASVGTHSPF